MKSKPFLPLASLLFMLCFASAALFGDEARESLRCLSLTRIDHTEVIDNRTIAFFMLNGDIYINRLDQACRNLDRGRPFSYRTSTSQLCSVDVITLLENFGAGLNPTISCGLGVFEPADEDLIEILRGDEQPADVTVEEIEVDQ